MRRASIPEPETGAMAGVGRSSRPGRPFPILVTRPLAGVFDAADVVRRDLEAAVGERGEAGGHVERCRGERAQRERVVARDHRLVEAELRGVVDRSVDADVRMRSTRYFATAARLAQAQRAGEVAA